MLLPFHLSSFFFHVLSLPLSNPSIHPSIHSSLISFHFLYDVNPVRTFDSITNVFACSSSSAVFSRTHQYPSHSSHSALILLCNNNFFLHRIVRNKAAEKAKSAFSGSSSSTSTSPTTLTSNNNNNNSSSNNNNGSSNNERSSNNNNNSSGNNNSSNNPSSQTLISSPSQATSVIVSANNQQNNNQQTPHTTYSINGILGIDGIDRKGRKGASVQHHITDHHNQLSPPGHTNGVVELDVSDLKRRPSTGGLNSGISQYNGLTNNENLYLSWSQGAPYGDTPESVHPPHHYESTSLYTPPTLGKFLSVLSGNIFYSSLGVQNVAS